MDIVSFSGGKDSTAMLIGMLEKGYNIDRIIFADTMYEFPEMYDYIDKVNRYIKRFGNYEIEIVKTDDNLDRWLYGEITRGKSKGQIRGFPLVLFPCYWSRESKFKVLDQEMKGHDRYIGIALDEVKRVSKHKDKLKYNYPLIDWGWSEEDCINYLKEKGLHNPLYDKFNRLGCWWCPKQSIKSLEVLYNEYPNLWNKLKNWETKLKKLDPDKCFKMDTSISDLENKFKVGKNNDIKR